MHRIYNSFTNFDIRCRNYVHKSRGIILRVRKNKKTLENIEKEAQINEPVRHYLLCKYGCENFPVRRV